MSQPSQWTGGNIAQRLENGLQHGVLRQVLNGEEDDEDFLFVNMSSNRLRHAYQSHRVSVGEWRRNEEPVKRLFTKLSRILNSNEQFEMDDSFQTHNHCSSSITVFIWSSLLGHGFPKCVVVDFVECQYNKEY